MGRRINKCPSWDPSWGCAISPLKSCISCANADWHTEKKKKLPAEITKQKRSISDSLHHAMPEYFRELDDPDIVDVYVPSTKPAYNKVAKLTYWPILHIFKSKATGRYYRIIFCGHVHSREEELRNMLIEVNYTSTNESYDDVKKAMLAASRCKADYCCKQYETKNKAETVEIMQCPIMVTTYDGVFEMYTVGIQHCSTWPHLVILDKWFYYLVKDNDTFDVQCTYDSTIWMCTGWYDPMKVKFTDKFINCAPLDCIASYDKTRDAEKNFTTPWQFCCLDDAEQFAYSLEDAMDRHGEKGHTELLHRLMVYNKWPDTYRTLYPVGSCFNLSLEDELAIKFDMKTQRWILVPQQRTND